jgi:Flp pilus assembly protein TadB
MEPNELQRRVQWISALLLLAGIGLAALVYWLTGALVLILVFAPPLVAWWLQRRARRHWQVNGDPFS